MYKLKHKLSLTLSLILLLAASVLMGGCGNKNEQQAGSTNADASSQGAGKTPYHIGAVLEISGNSSSLGVPERDTLLMLVENLNQKGGIDGHPVELTILDNKSDETESVMAVKKLMQKNVLAVLGCASSGPTMAMINAVQSEKVPLVSMAAASSIVEPAADRPWVFKTAQSDIVTVTNIINYLQKANIDQVAFLYMNNAYGDGGKIAFTKAAQKSGIKVAALEKFEAGDNDMTPQLTKVKASGAKAAIVWAIPPSASIITKNFRDLALDIPLLHSHGVGNQNFIDLAQGAADGVILPIGKLMVADQLTDQDPQKQILEDYMAAYQAKYNSTPNSFGGYAYDAFNLVVNAIATAGADRAAIRDELEKTTSYAGVSGVFNLSPQDHNGLDADSMILVQIKGNQWHIID